MFTFIAGLVVGSILTLIISNNISAKEKASLQADLNAANAKLASAAASITKK